MSQRSRELQPEEELDFDDESSANGIGEKRPKAPVRRKGDLQIDGTSSGLLENDQFISSLTNDALGNREAIIKLTK